MSRRGLTMNEEGLILDQALPIELECDGRDAARPEQAGLRDIGRQAQVTI